MGDTIISSTHRTIRRGALSVDVLVEFRRPEGAPRLYELVMRATGGDGTAMHVFIYHAAVPRPSRDGDPKDEFIGVADALDMDELPVDSPRLEDNIPYYRTSELSLLFRNSDMMYETADALIESLRGK